jgi:hypothetical protein
LCQPSKHFHAILSRFFLQSGTADTVLPPQYGQHCHAAMAKLAKGTVGSRAACDGRTQAGQAIERVF